MPYFNSTVGRLYYLEGDSDVRYLARDGSSGLAKRLPVGHLQHAGFAVSPDDLKIAVSIIDYSVDPHRLRVFTEDLSDGGSHRELFTSTTRFEWPVQLDRWAAAYGRRTNGSAIRHLRPVLCR